MYRRRTESPEVWSDDWKSDFILLPIIPTFALFEFDRPEITYLLG